MDAETRKRYNKARTELNEARAKVKALQKRNDNQAGEIIRLGKFAQDNAKLTGINERLQDEIDMLKAKISLITSPE